MLSSAQATRLMILGRQSAGFASTRNQKPGNNASGAAGWRYFDMNTKTTNEQLDAVTLNQLSWKPNLCRNIAVRIVQHFLDDRIAYTDEVDLSFVPTADANCIGPAFRRIREQGIIAETGRFRRNNKERRPGRKGGKAYQYRLISVAKAKTFLVRNDWLPNLTKGQSEMFPAAELAKPEAVK